MVIEKEEIGYIVYGFVEIEEKYISLKSYNHSPLTAKSNKQLNDKQVRMIVVIKNGINYLKIKNVLD